MGFLHRIHLLQISAVILGEAFSVRSQAQSFGHTESPAEGRSERVDALTVSLRKNLCDASTKKHIEENLTTALKGASDAGALTAQLRKRPEILRDALIATPLNGAYFNRIPLAAPDRMISGIESAPRGAVVHLKVPPVDLRLELRLQPTRVELVDVLDASGRSIDCSVQWNQTRASGVESKAGARASRILNVLEREHQVARMKTKKDEAEGRLAEASAVHEPFSKSKLFPWNWGRVGKKQIVAERRKDLAAIDENYQAAVHKVGESAAPIAQEINHDIEQEINHDPGLSALTAHAAALDRMVAAPRALVDGFSRNDSTLQSLQSDLEQRPGTRARSLSAHADLSQELIRKEGSLRQASDLWTAAERPRLQSQLQAGLGAQAQLQNDLAVANQALLKPERDLSLAEERRRALRDKVDGESQKAALVAISRMPADFEKPDAEEFKLQAWKKKHEIIVYDINKRKNTLGQTESLVTLLENSYPLEAGPIKAAYQAERAKVVSANAKRKLERDAAQIAARHETENVYKAEMQTQEQVVATYRTILKPLADNAARIDRQLKTSRQSASDLSRQIQSGDADLASRSQALKTERASEQNDAARDSSDWRQWIDQVNRNVAGVQGQSNGFQNRLGSIALRYEHANARAPTSYIAPAPPLPSTSYSGGLVSPLDPNFQSAVRSTDDMLGAFRSRGQLQSDFVKREAIQPLQEDIRVVSDVVTSADRRLRKSVAESLPVEVLNEVKSSSASELKTALGL